MAILHVLIFTVSGHNTQFLRYFKTADGFPGSVAKCRGSWVVGRGRGSWVWVGINVVGKEKVFQKKIKLKNQKAKSCKIHETKISVYMPVLLPFPAVSKANKRII